MHTLISKFQKMFNSKPRLPQASGILVALSDAVIIHTHDGNSIVVTPQFAKEISEKLPSMAIKAESAKSEEKP